MGTRADFYVGLTPQQGDYLGSIAFDGDEIDECAISRTKEEWCAAVRRFIASRDHGSFPVRDGWPWPWNTSATSDCAYTFADGRVFAAVHSPEVWVPFDELVAANNSDDPDAAYDALTGPLAQFPDMSGIKRATFGSRSGLMVFDAQRLIDAKAIDEEERRRTGGRLSAAGGAGE